VLASVAIVLLLLVVASVRSLKKRAFIKRILRGEFGRILDSKRTFHLLEEINRESDRYAFIPEKVIEFHHQGKGLEIVYGSMSYFCVTRTASLNYQQGFFMITPNGEVEKYLSDKGTFRLGVTVKNYSVLFVNIRKILPYA
jgi:hypothetical protein